VNGLRLALALANRNLQLRQPRPYFAELPYYLWGQVNYDSEGDCKKPPDRQWTWMYLQHRGTRGVVDVKQENGEWLIEGDDETSARLAMFLIERCGGRLDPSLSAAAGQWDHPAALARTLPVRSEFEQSALAPFDTKLFWGSWKWVGKVRPATAPATTRPDREDMRIIANTTEELQAFLKANAKKMNVPGGGFTKLRD
jgi:hypothetical protein